MFGHSYLWLVMIFFLPYYSWCQFVLVKSASIKDTKNGTIRWYLRALITVRSKSGLGFIYWLLKSSWTINQIFFSALETISIVLGLQNGLLAALDKNLKPDSLTYKVIYFGPISLKFCSLLSTFYLIITAERHNNLIYDKFPIVCVSQRRQFNAMVYAIVCLMPDIILSFLRALLAVIFLRHKHELEDQFRSFFKLNSAQNVLLIAYVFYTTTTNICLRYRGIIWVTYAQACIQDHVSLLCNYLDKNAQGLAQELPLTGLNKPTDSFRRASSGNGILRSHRGRNNLVELKSLSQLEHHLSQINSMVAEIDQDTRDDVLTCTILGLTHVIISSLTMFYLPAELFFAYVAVLNVCSRAIPIIFMLYTGTQMRANCLKLAKQLEVMYLQNECASLVYKQLGSTSNQKLLRIFALISSLEFSCGGLMRINLNLMGRFGSHALAFYFVVVQNDILLRYKRKDAKTEASKNVS